MTTREQMIEKYGNLPMGMPKDTLYRWTICRAHADVTWKTTDGGETWTKGDITWANERNRRDLEALEMQRIQREEK